MLTQQDLMIADCLAVRCNVPKLFAVLVMEIDTIESGSISFKLNEYKKKIEYLDKLLQTNGEIDETMEFHAQCLASHNDVPIQLARMVIASEKNENISEESLISLRNERVNFVSKVFAFVQNIPNQF